METLILRRRSRGQFTVYCSFPKRDPKQNENKMDDEELEELYLTWKSEVLKELRPFLVDNLEPQKLFAYLRSCQVLDSDDQEDIEAERTRRRKNERLLDHIKNRGADGFDNLCEAIRRNTTQLFILRKILNLFQKKKDNCTGSLTETHQKLQIIKFKLRPFIISYFSTYGPSLKSTTPDAGAKVASGVQSFSHRRFSVGPTGGKTGTMIDWLGGGKVKSG